MKPTAPTGEQLKLAAHALLTAHRAALLRRARRAFLGVLFVRGEGTIDDVRAVVPTPSGINPTAFGPFASELAYARIVEAAGFRKTTRPKGHARPVTVWRLIDRDAADAWLAANPEPLADDTPQTSEAASVLPDAASKQRSLFA